MKVPYRWLSEFVPVAATAEALAGQLTEAGLEVESVSPVAPPFSGVIVGEVLECARHPDAEKLSVCKVTTDGADRLQIICGAPNVRAGLKVAVAMVGAKLPNDVTIRRAKLRGLESFGMLCSARELGLGDEHDGIMELPATLALGLDVRAALDLDDAVLEVNATPNRGDCMSVFGIARDYAAAQQRRYLTASVPAVAAHSADTVPVRLEAGAACPRFARRVIRGIRPGVPSPPWLRERLRRIGMGSISPAVDVTNYVMAEYGQPLHAFDLAKLKEGLTVRWATPGESVTLLDGKHYPLDGRYLVVADGSGAVALAGIMGAQGTAIGEATTDVLLEAAHWAPAAIAGRARRIGLFTDAAQRFERGVDPTLPALALERATALLLEIAGGVAGPLEIEESTDAAPRHSVFLRRNRLTRLLGTTVPDDEVHRLLAAISDRVAVEPEGWRVEAPPHRFDLRIEVDLIEEVARLRGFAQIPEVAATNPQAAGEASEAHVDPERLIAALVDRGYREAITYSFVEPAVQRQLFPQSPALALSNPISAELSEMRVSLWPGLILAARDNLRRQQPRVRMFEVGKKFVLDDTGLREIETIAGIVVGARWPEQWGGARDAADFFDVKADVEALCALTGEHHAWRYEAAELSALRPGRTARIYRGEVAVGWLGELHPERMRALGLSTAPFVFELELESTFVVNPLKYQRISKFPSIRRDLSVVVDESLPLAALQENVSVSASGLLSELRVFDIYRGPGIDFGRKSIALGLILQDSSRTLTDVDADAVVTKVVARLRDELSATIRDQ